MKHVIIGNGPAGVVAAETVRRTDPQAEITLLGEEPEPPYSRMAIPYFLSGNIGEEGTHLRKEKDHFERLDIRLVHGRAENVAQAGHSVRLAGGKTLAWDRLIIASGSHPIRPPVAGIDLPGVQTCWTLEDARRIAATAKRGARVLQIGAGFIGCIIMEALAARGVRLTVAEMGDRMVPRMMTEKAGNLIRKWCEHKGVRVHTCTKVESIRKDAKGGELVAKLDTGDEIVADLIICAAGVAPNVGFLKDSGIAVDRGILVDTAMRTSMPDIYAAGDVTEAADMLSGERMLNAIQPSAVDQARIAAINAAGGKADSKGSLAINVLDTLGLISSSFGQWWGDVAGESVEMTDEANYRYLSLQLRDDMLIGATSIGLTEHVGVLRGLIQGRIRLGEWKERLLKDPTRIMEAYLASGQGAETRYLGTRPI